MTVDELFDQFRAGFGARAFSAGLLIALIDFLVELGVPSRGFRSLEDFFAAFPKRTTTRQGKQANTLIVARGGGTLSIRPFYNAIEKSIRAEHHRFDYPSCAPHATQAWNSYSGWLAALVTLNESALLALRQRVLEFVLAFYPDQSFDPADARREPPVFRFVLDGFDLTAQPGEKSGAAFQGIVFGFLRADNPHLQVEIRKVRTGSARLHGVGDVDCWDGGSLAISAEVKQFVINDPSMFNAFAAEVNKRGAVGMVVGIDFSNETVRDEIESLGVRALSLYDLLRIAELWDPIKQRTAVNSMFYYVEHVERSSSLATRLRTYLDQQGASALPPDAVRSQSGPA